MVNFTDLSTHVQINIDGKNNVFAKNSLFLQENEHGIISVYFGSQLVVTENYNDFTPNGGDAQTTIQAISPLIYS